MKSIMSEKYRLCFKLYYKQASDATKAKLRTIKENPNSGLENDVDIVDFARKVCELAECEEVS